jgi:murein L,D-transpeptidase YcbB/YkuD
MRALKLELAAGTVLAFALSSAGALAYTASDDAPVQIAAPADDAFSSAPRPLEAAQPVAATTAAPAREVDGVPVPEAAELPPITAATVGAPDAAPAPSAPATAALPAALSESAVMGAIPLPEPANVPPPTVKDIGKVPLTTADAAVADKLKDLIGKADRLIPAKKDRSAVEAFYQARDFAPLWLDNGQPNARLKAAIARLRQADQDGLEPGDYPVPDLKTLGTAPDALADMELKLTNAVLTYARHAQAGRVSPSRISNNIDFTPPVPETAEVLTKIAAAKDVAKELDAFNPPHDGFRALKAKLGELRGRSGDHEVVQIPAGRVLKVQKRPMDDPRVPALRERLGVAGDATDTQYDAKLAEAVKEFQKHKGLSATGILSQATVEALNGRSRSRDIDVIVSTMERWRWLPRDLGKTYVMVNVPDFSLKLVHNGAVPFRTRIVVGKPGTPSPSFATKMENILVNPTWHVPESIIYNEYLPALQQDPTVLSRMGLVVEHTRDGRIAIRQPPGERNALGRIKFNIPNRFQVYLHDTPDKGLFNHDRRAYSHGCMRVQNPLQFGEALLAIAMPQEHYTAERLQRMFGTGEQWLKFKQHIPVYLTYMNAYVDDGGKLVVREDLYGYDGRVRAALRGEGLPALAEKSQVVRPVHAAAGGRRLDRRVVQQQPQRGFFLFPFFQ